MNIVVLTPESSIYSGDITSVKVPGKNGQFEVLKGHTAIVAALGKGEVRIYDMNNKAILIHIEKGFIEVLKDDISLLVQGAIMRD